MELANLSKGDLIEYGHHEEVLVVHDNDIEKECLICCAQEEYFTTSYVRIPYDEVVRAYKKVFEEEDDL